LQVGYKSAAAFTHAFKQHFGYIPSTLRDSKLNGIRQGYVPFESTFIAGEYKITKI
jgi:AraC-like DNA-binding protein